MWLQKAVFAVLFLQLGGINMKHVASEANNIRYEIWLNVKHDNGTVILVILDHTRPT